VSLNYLFDKSDDLDTGSVLRDRLNDLRSEFEIASDDEATALQLSLQMATFSAQQNPRIAVRYCQELDWEPRDLAVMMTMQCAISSATSGEFALARGALSPIGQGFRRIAEGCLQILVETGRITQAIADIELRELDADIDETEPLLMKTAAPASGAESEAATKDPSTALYDE
jgi:hypothetical protein